MSVATEELDNLRTELDGPADAVDGRNDVVAGEVVLRPPVRSRRRSQT